MRRSRIVVGDKPLLVVEDTRSRGRQRPRPLCNRDRLIPGAPAVVGGRNRDADMAAVLISAPGAKLGHMGGSKLRVECRRWAAVPAVRPVAHRDLAIDPCLSAVERDEEAGGYARVNGIAGEADEVVV